MNRFLFFATLVFYLFFAFMRPDYVVAKYNIAHMEEISSYDMYYLTNLSLDAVPALTDIKEEQMNENAKNIVRNYYTSLYDSHKKDIRNFNLSRYQAYQIAKEKISE